MKFTSIVKFAGAALLVACIATGCQNKKKAEAEARARAEAEARARAEAEAAALAARVFVISPEAAAVASEDFYSSADEFKAGLAASLKATKYGANQFALPGASFLFNVERCGLTPEHKALMVEFVNAWLASDQSATILVEPYAADVKDKCYNKAIAVERANRVEAYLLYLGVPAKKICVAQPACGCCADKKACCGEKKQGCCGGGDCCCAPKARAFEGACADKRCCRISIK